MGQPPDHIAGEAISMLSETSPAEADAVEVHKFTMAGTGRKDSLPTPTPALAFLLSKFSLCLHSSFPFRIFFEVQD